MNQITYTIPSTDASDAKPPADICAKYRPTAPAESSGSNSIRCSGTLGPRSPSAIAEYTANSFRSR